MNNAMKIFLGIIIVLFVGIFSYIVIKVIDVKNGKSIAEREYKNAHCEPLENIGSVKKLTIMPVIDYFSERTDLETESGVSYIINADNTAILMDTGYNQHEEHPSPLLRNMKKLGVKLDDIDMLYISHLHPDHVGGMAPMRDKTFNFTDGKLEMTDVTAFTPEKMNQSKRTPVCNICITKNPSVLLPGICTIGAIPRHLFIMGKTYEQSLAINVEGKGIVLIIGCGHQGIGKILERTRALFEEPIYAIIGGLHFPIHGGRAKIGPLNIQYIIGSDSPPWNGLQESDVFAAVDLIKESKAKIVALSPHDSSDWSLCVFKERLGKVFVDVKVGKEIKI